MIIWSQEKCTSLDRMQPSVFDPPCIETFWERWQHGEYSPVWLDKLKLCIQQYQWNPEDMNVIHHFCTVAYTQHSDQLRDRGWYSLVATKEFFQWCATSSKAWIQLLQEQLQEIQLLQSWTIMPLRNFNQKYHTTFCTNSLLFWLNQLTLLPLCQTCAEDYPKRWSLIVEECRARITQINQDLLQGIKNSKEVPSNVFVVAQGYFQDVRALHGAVQRVGALYWILAAWCHHKCSLRSPTIDRDCLERLLNRLSTGIHWNTPHWPKRFVLRPDEEVDCEAIIKFLQCLYWRSQHGPWRASIKALRHDLASRLCSWAAEKSQCLSTSALKDPIETSLMKTIQNDIQTEASKQCLEKLVAFQSSSTTPDFASLTPPQAGQALGPCGGEIKTLVLDGFDPYLYKSLQHILKTAHETILHWINLLCQEKKTNCWLKVTDVWTCTEAIRNWKPYDQKEASPLYLEQILQAAVIRTSLTTGGIAQWNCNNKCFMGENNKPTTLLLYMDEAAQEWLWAVQPKLPTASSSLVPDDADVAVPEETLKVAIPAMPAMPAMPAKAETPTSLITKKAIHLTPLELVPEVPLDQVVQDYAITPATLQEIVNVKRMRAPEDKEQTSQHKRPKKQKKQKKQKTPPKKEPTREKPMQQKTKFAFLLEQDLDGFCEKYRKQTIPILQSIPNQGVMRTNLFRELELPTPKLSNFSDLFRLLANDKAAYPKVKIVEAMDPLDIPLNKGQAALVSWQQGSHFFMWLQK